MEATPNQAYHDLVDWLSQFEVNQPLAAYIQDPSLLEPPPLSLEEVQAFEALGLAYLQELSEQGLLPEASPMDIDPQPLEPPKQIDRDSDFGR